MYYSSYLLINCFLQITSNAASREGVLPAGRRALGGGIAAFACAHPPLRVRLSWGRGASAGWGLAVAAVLQPLVAEQAIEYVVHAVTLDLAVCLQDSFARHV